MNKMWIILFGITGLAGLLGAMWYGFHDEWSRATFNLVMGYWFYDQALKEIEKA